MLFATTTPTMKEESSPPPPPPPPQSTTGVVPTLSPAAGGGGDSGGDRGNSSAGTTVISLDDVPVTVLYFAIGFAVFITAAIVSWIFQALALLWELVLAVAVPLSIGCILILHDALQQQHYCLPTSVVYQWEHAHGTQLLAVASLGAPLLTFLTLGEFDSNYYFYERLPWILHVVWAVKSLVVVAILSRRFFQFVQHIQRHKELPVSLLQLLRTRSYQELMARRQHLVDMFVILTSIVFELYYLSRPQPDIYTLFCYSWASLGGAVVALRRIWCHLQKRWSHSSSSCSSSIDDEVDQQQPTADKQVDSDQSITTMPLLLHGKDCNV